MDHYANKETELKIFFKTLGIKFKLTPKLHFTDEFQAYEHDDAFKHIFLK